MYNTIMARPIMENRPSTTEEKPYILNATDRCDSCSAQAYVMVKGSTGELLFCGHHYDKIMNNPDAYIKMMGFMLEITDERDRLIENRSQGKDY
jgi:hypothetical protein